MEIKLSLFKTLTSSQFATTTKYFVADKRKELVTRFQDWCANVAARTYEYGDSKHANKMAYAAEICGYGPMFRRCVVPLIPFAYNRDEGFHGSIQAGKRSALLNLNENGDPKWEADMRERFDTDNEPKDSKPKPFNVKRFDTLVKDAHAAGITDAEIKKYLAAALKAHPAIREVEVQQVKEGLAKEQAETAKAA